MAKVILCMVLFFLTCQTRAYTPTVPYTSIEGEWVKMEVTAYTADECDKAPDHPYYGITASGEKVKEHHTIAAGPSIPFGTKIYIPKYLKCFTVEDRGGAIGDSNIDIYMEDIDEVNKFGRQQMWVFVVEGDSQLPTTSVVGL